MPAIRLLCTIVALLVAATVPSHPQQRGPRAAPALEPRFEALVDRYLAGPAGRNDFSESYFLRRLDFWRELQKELASVDRAALTFDQDIDFRYMESLLADHVHEGERVRAWERDPTLYLRPEPLVAAEGGLLFQENSPAGARARDLLPVLQSLVVRLDNGRANLKFFVPQWHQQAREQLEGLEMLVGRDVPAFARRVPEHREALVEGSRSVMAAIERFRPFLEVDLPSRPRADWRAGEELLDARLKHAYLIDDMNADAFYRWGRQKYDEQIRTLERVAAREGSGRSWRQIELDLQADHPAAEESVYEFHKAVKATRPWILEHDLVSIPWDTENAAAAIATPPFYGRITFTGFGGAPRGFGLSRPGSVKIVPLDPSWSPERQSEFLRSRNRAFIWALMPHEVYPGHGLVQLYLNHNPRKLRAATSSYSNQSWCYYVEWVLTPEFDFYPADRHAEFLVEMERLKLWRYARVIYDIGMHTGRVSFDEAVDLMTGGVMFAERFSRMQVQGATHSYGGTAISTLGYHQVVALRDEYLARMYALGRPGTLKDFHDRFLKIGMLPMALMREALLHGLQQDYGAAPKSSSD